MMLLDFRRIALESETLGLFLKNYFSEILQNKKHFSLRRVSTKMGYKHPSYLSDILNGRRTPTLDFLYRLKLLQDLSPLEMEYLVALMLSEQATSEEIKNAKREEVELFREFWATKPDLQSAEAAQIAKLLQFEVSSELVPQLDIQVKYFFEKIKLLQFKSEKYPLQNQVFSAIIEHRVV